MDGVKVPSPKSLSVQYRQARCLDISSINKILLEVQHQTADIQELLQTSMLANFIQLL